MVENCEVCHKNVRSKSKPTVAIPRSSDFYVVITMDLKEMGKMYILWMVYAFTKIIKGMVMKD